MGKNNPREIKARREREMQAAAAGSATGNVAADVGAIAELDSDLDDFAQSTSIPKTDIPAGSASNIAVTGQADISQANPNLVTGSQSALDSIDGEPTTSDQPVSLEEQTQDSAQSEDGIDIQSEQLPVIDGSSIQSYEVRERKPINVRKVIKRIIISLIVVIIAAVVGIIIAFSVFRWNMYSDAEDIVGTWQVEGSDSTIEITEDAINLTDDISYKYVLDEDAKTISFIFGNLTGEGHYRFSLDRNSLAIIDGEWDWNQSLTDDAQWTANALVDQYINGMERSPHADYDDKNVTALKKLPSVG